MKNQKNRQIIALIINIICLGLELWAILDQVLGVVPLGTELSGTGPIMLKYFTNDSNVILAISNLIMIVFLLLSIFKDITIPKFAIMFKFVCTTAVSTTMLVSVFYLLPTMGAFILEPTCLLYLHLICPLLAIASFIFFELEHKISYKQALCSFIPVLLYTIIVVPIVSVGMIPDHYGFLDAAHNPWYVSVLAIIFVIGGTYAFGCILVLLRNIFIKKWNIE